MFGPTIQPALPLERDRFVIADRRTDAERAASGGRVQRVHVQESPQGRGPGGRPHQVGDRAARGVDGERARVAGADAAVSWNDMPQFYQGLDVLVCPSRVEGGPMPVLEALACGVRVVIPQHVGILDELPDVPGIHRYPRGDLASLIAALEGGVPAQPLTARRCGR